MYRVVLSKKQKDRFYLVPLENTPDIKKVKFDAENREERARWFKALSKSQQQNKVDNMSFSATCKDIIIDFDKENSDDTKKPEFKLGDMLSLTEISEILTSSNSVLQQTLIGSQEIFSNLILQFNELLS